MSTRKALPVGTMFLVLVIALALVGVGFALWSETLTIEGTVSTGEVDVELSAIDSEECVDVNGVLTCPEPEEKADVADCTVTEAGPDEDSPGDSGTDQLLVTVTGMYPSYHCKVSFKVLSTGNVPVHVWLPKPIENGGIPEWVSTNFEDCYTDGVQLHQDDLSPECTIDIHFTNDQAPPEGESDITFGWTILATQWNEDPPPVPGAIYVLSSELFYNGAGGWAGWSCPANSTVVGGGFLPPTADVAVSMAWKPGASVGIVNYPDTPWGGYTYTPPEEGWIVQDGGTPNVPTYIFLWCLPNP